MAVVSLSVCLSRAWPYKSRMEGHSKLEIGRKDVHDTGDPWPWPHFEVERSKVKVTRPLNAVTENQPYIRKRKAYTNFNLVRMEDLQAESSGWLFQSPVTGAGTYCGGRTTGRTGYLTLLLIDSLWKCLIQIILKLSSAVSRSSVSVYQVSLWLAAPKIF